MPVVGIAYMPAAGDFFVAVQGGGTTHNGKPVHVSKVGPLSDATVTHGGLQQFTMSGVGDALIRLANACDIARGCPDFDGYRQILLGRSDAMVDPGVQPYDICAPAVLIREAGRRHDLRRRSDRKQRRDPRRARRGAHCNSLQIGDKPGDGRNGLLSGTSCGRFPRSNLRREV
ncbi:MAG: hypothetical protein AMJ63_02650 [Myxococcales bacterium SG8_38_1]|nr:MAG: hypothetical protein AMJ63_02650 [Myxococcales bacterium SG8_38_1]